MLGIDDQLGVDDAVDPDGPLATPFTFTDGSAGARTVGNRFAVLPMEGWDGERRRFDPPTWCAAGGAASARAAPSSSGAVKPSPSRTTGAPTRASS